MKYNYRNFCFFCVKILTIYLKFRPKIKELLKVILKICDFDEEQIANIFRDKEQKKKSFFGFIRK